MAIVHFASIFERVPARLNLCLMIFSCCAVSYMLRVNMSVNLLAMVPATPVDNATSECMAPSAAVMNKTSDHVSIADTWQTSTRAPNRKTFEWSQGAQSLILGSYYWGYLGTSLFGGLAAERWGPRRVVAATTAVGAFFTVACVPAAHTHYAALIAARFIIGLAGGLIYPALHTLIAHWAPPSEKGKFISALAGGTLGTVITWSFTGPLIEQLGWNWAFYIPAVLAFVWCALWLYLVADTPAEHPRISEEEKKYIQDGIGDKITRGKKLPPLKKILTSLPFLAMVVLHYGNMWGLYFIMTVGPKFMLSVLGFQLATAGFISALPYLARLIFSMIFGLIGDCIVEKGRLSTTAIRKWFTVFSHVIPGLLLVSLLYAGCSRALAVACITMSMGWNGAATLTNLQNHQDLAPNFAGTLYGIANFVGGTTGFITPLVTWYFTKNGNTFGDWQPVFFIGATVYIMTALFFALFGTGETQSWNEVEDATAKKEEDTKQKTNDIAISVINKN